MRVAEKTKRDEISFPRSVKAVSSARFSHARKSKMKGGAPKETNHALIVTDASQIEQIELSYRCRSLQRRQRRLTKNCA